MKKIVMLTLTAYVIILCFSGCKKSAESNLEVVNPVNLNISVTGRLLTVTWDPVENAVGYIVNTFSEECGSGKRIVNTFTKTVTNYDGVTTKSDTADVGIIDQGNGFVTFTGPTSFTILLMKEPDPGTGPMATSITAKVSAVYVMSKYSSEVTLNKADYKPAK